MRKIITLFNFSVGRLLAHGIRWYQISLSPDHGLMRRPWGYCRFFPSCSEYTRQALVRHGAFRGIALGARRLLKCHPLHPPAFDPVP